MTKPPHDPNFARKHLETTLANLEAQRRLLELRIATREGVGEDSSGDKKELERINEEIARVQDRLKQP